MLTIIMHRMTFLMCFFIYFFYKYRILISWYMMFIKHSILTLGHCIWVLDLLARGLNYSDPWLIWDAISKKCNVIISNICFVYSWLWDLLSVSVFICKRKYKCSKCVLLIVLLYNRLELNVCKWRVQIYVSQRVCI